MYNKSYRKNIKLIGREIIMKNAKMLKKGIATALLATMAVTGVEVFSADASVETNARNTVQGGEKQAYGEKLKKYDEEGKNKWNKEYEVGYEEGAQISLLIFANHIVAQKFVEGTSPAYEQGFTKGLLSKVVKP